MTVTRMSPVQVKASPSLVFLTPQGNVVLVMVRPSFSFTRHHWGVDALSLSKLSFCVASTIATSPPPCPALPSDR